ncbi:hypothetical protein OGAPHI_006027 [Ogataea philodendri]|uniref:Xylanolytic transcriptional activator regulatory domain-containing protein n=1 Tax=Ogataea philodendri TaxID=1378263 RepID=A0A9P8T0K0_9ASCO|nr:uncharacterized protein OGAPHI_006027 [Ogataea philodendri]KAH3661848.1 hypothetical protein OGAPHI_006027 [Ogataea philodendri]
MNAFASDSPYMVSTITQPRSNERTTSHTPERSSPDSKKPMMNELQMLKDKINQIEASIAVADLSQPRINSATPMPPLTNQLPGYKTPLPPIQLWGPNKSQNLPPLTSSVSWGSMLSDSGSSAIVPSDSGMNPADAFNFYDGYVSVHALHWRVSNHGPLMWITLVRKDPYLHPLWYRIVEFRRRNKLSEFFASQVSTTSQKQEKQFRQKVYETEGVVDVLPFREAKLEHKRSDLDPPKKTQDAKEGLNLYDDKTQPDNSIMVQIKKALPKKKVLWLLVDRYFRYVYPFLPYLDEESFMLNVEEVVGTRSFEDSKIRTVNIEKRLHFATVGTLLIVLRLAYLSLVANHEDPRDFPERTEEERYLLQNPIEIETITVAQSCLNQFKLLKRCALSVFQFALMMKEYRFFAPEDGTDGFGDGEGQCFLGLLIQMAISIGLNRDTTKISGLESSRKLENIWRKIWYGLVSSDVYQATQLGNPLVLRDEMYDTKLPVFDHDNSNNSDLGLEKVVIECLHEKHSLEVLMKDLSSKVLSMSKPPTIEGIFSSIRAIEAFIENNFGSLKSILTLNSNSHLDNVRKVYRMTGFLQARSLIHPVLSHVFIYYAGRSNQVATRYLMKLNIPKVVEINSLFVQLVKKSYLFFGSGFDLMLTPALEASIHKALQLQFTLYVRTNHHKNVLSLNSSPGSINLIKSINRFSEDGLISNIKSYLRGLTLISSKYFYAWRMNKAQTVIVKMLQDDKDSVSNMHLFANLFNVFEGFTAEDFDYLAEIGNIKNYTIDPFSDSKSSAIADDSASIITSDSLGRTPEDVDLDSFWREQLMKLNSSSSNPNHLIPAGFEVSDWVGINPGEPPLSPLRPESRQASAPYTSQNAGLTQLFDTSSIFESFDLGSEYFNT